MTMNKGLKIPYKRKEIAGNTTALLHPFSTNTKGKPVYRQEA
jgi:hypothetical protein